MSNSRAMLRFWFLVLIAVFTVASPASLRAQPQLTAEQIAVMQPLDPSQVPIVGTFWLWTGPGPKTPLPPAPSPLQGVNAPIYALDDGSFLIDCSQAADQLLQSSQAGMASFAFQASQAARPTYASPAAAAFNIDDANPIPTNQIPRAGTFWSMQNPSMPPMPSDPAPGCNHADGNGNIAALMNSGQSLVAKYLYDPFGNILSQSGPLADANLYRFSSQEFHPNSGLICYPRRFYNPGLQRWLNQDPIGEAGGANLFEFVGNCPISEADPYGYFNWGQAFNNYMQQTASDFKDAANDLNQLGNAIGNALTAPISDLMAANQAFNGAVDRRKQLDRCGFVNPQDLKMQSRNPGTITAGDPDAVAAAATVAVAGADVDQAFWGLAAGGAESAEAGFADAAMEDVAEEAPVLGGAYSDIEAGAGEVHHMPADSVSTLSRGDGPAIRMDTADHQLTASWGSSAEAQEYRAAQAELINQGKFGDALQMDINDIQSKFGTKYDVGIQQMLNYYNSIPTWKLGLH